MEGFYSGVQVASTRTPLSMVPQCGSCGLFKTCKSPKMEPTGKGRKDILIVAEAPGKEEDQQGVQLVGNSGKQLETTLRKFGVSLRDDCVLENAVRCRPPDNEIKDKKVIGYCRPNVLNTIKEHQPKVIILLGAKAVESVIGHVWREDVGPIGRWVGWNVPLRKYNAWVCPTFHPAYLLRMEDPVLNKAYRDHLKAAVSKTERPYETVPDDSDRVELIYDPIKAARRIEGLIEGHNGTRLVAYDYETNMLKPDSKEAEIVCCSISDGKNTFAFPWEPASDRLMSWFREFIRSPIPKVCSNAKFEYRWTRKIVGVTPNGFRSGHDTMLDAHALDPRGKISGLKFQAFVNLGVEDYSAEVSPYLNGGGGNAKNRIREVPMETVLKYCGLDSLYEWEVAQIQRKVK